MHSPFPRPTLSAVLAESMDRGDEDTAAVVVPESAVPGPQADQGRECGCMCMDCGRTFGTRTGLGVHRRRAHPLAFHASNIPLRVKARWDEEEVYTMAVREAQLVHDGVKFVNQALVQFVPGRSLEAIKGKRMIIEDFRNLT